MSMACQGEEIISIIQPYYDGGESNHETYKYSLTKQYKEEPVGCLKQGWDAFKINLKAHDAVSIENDSLEIDISGFDKFRIFCMIPNCVHVKMYCNGKLVIDKQASGEIGYLESEEKNTQKVLKQIRYEFANSGKEPVEISIYYLGMVNNAQKCNLLFNEEWKGFFAETPNCELFHNNIIEKEELECLKKKINQEPYKSGYEIIRKIALGAMQDVPEGKIGKTVRAHFRAPYKLIGASELAIVGQIENNPDMLRMACRYALSLGCCEYWCSDVMETVPMITWHHRSFDEAYVIREIGVVLSLAGGLLSPHGRNFLYQMIIMKGFPRMEADFMTMEYIYHCNQGIAFLSDYVLGLTTVAQVYARYKTRLSEAVALLEEMRQNSFCEDGSYGEGAVYWDYIMRRYLVCANLLAKYEKKDLKEFIGNKLDKTAKFGMAMLGETGEFLTFNDSGQYERYSMIVPAMLYRLTDREEWASVFYKSSTGDALELLLSFTVDMAQSDKPFYNEFSYFPNTGFIRIFRDGILFAGMAGPSNSTHRHGDKGGFIIQNKGEVLVPDCSDNYNIAEAVILHRSAAHSIAIPVINGKLLEQQTGEGYEAVVETASYENGIFEWKCDTSQLWDSFIVTQCKRTVTSNKANEFIITDEFQFTEPSCVEFRMNIKNDDSVKIEPVNWEPEQVDFVELYTRKGIVTYQKRMRSKCVQQIHMITKIIIL